MSLSGIIQKVKDLYFSYPAIVNSAIAGALVTLAAKFNVVLDQVNTATDVGVVLVLLLGGTATHRLVSPVAKTKRGLKKK